VRFIVELDGPLFAMAPVYHRAHRDVAAELGWSCLDQGTFWRLTRTKGSQANVLPGARPVKLEEYRVRFAALVESDALVDRYEPHAEVDDTVATLASHAACLAITTGTNLASRRRLLDRTGLARYLSHIEALDPDPRRRPAELRALADGDARAVVAASSDAIVRAAAAANLFAAGIASGACTAARLHQAGASIVYRNLQELVESLRAGGQDMIRMGLLPPSQG
jgi:phosphoglycolate phosphatase-like HAD superfamily hydrolase